MRLLHRNFYPIQARNLKAQKRLPEIFLKTEEEQTAIFQEITRQIADFELANPEAQGKNSHKANDQIPYSIFCFLDAFNQRHYYLNPRHHSEINKNGKREIINLLGRGAEGLVIPGYELLLKNGCYHLEPHSDPSIAIKVTLSTGDKPNPTPDLKYQIRLLNGNKLLIAMPRLITREREKSNKKIHKIYMGMSFVPGISAHNFRCQHTKFAQKIRNENSRQKKKNYFLNFFIETLLYCISIIEALETLHEKNIIHCDIKPENILFSEGKATIIDYGFAYSPNESARNPCGTPGFAAPELRLNNAKNTFQSDRFALGGTLYELLCLEPIDEEETTEKLEARDRMGPERISAHFLEDIPIDRKNKSIITKSIAKLLSKHPQKRPTLSDVKSKFLKIAQEIEPQRREFGPENPELSQLWKKLGKMAFFNERNPKERSQNLFDYFCKLFIEKNDDFETSEYNLMSIPSIQNDVLNFLCYFIELKNSNNSIPINEITFNSVINELVHYFQIEDRSQESKIQTLLNRVREENAKIDSISRWQYQRILREYRSRKDNTFLGLGWSFQSRISTQTMKMATESNCAMSRKQLLIDQYYKTENGFLWFKKPNKKRALDQAIEAIRSEIAAPAA